MTRRDALAHPQEADVTGAISLARINEHGQIAEHRGMVGAIGTLGQFGQLPAPRLTGPIGVYRRVP